jgi:hypothetical protein
MAKAVVSGIALTLLATVCMDAQRIILPAGSRDDRPTSGTTATHQVKDGDS